MTRPWIALAVCSLVLAPAGTARAQAGAEAALLTSQSARTLTGSARVGAPEWSPSRALPAPAPRTVRGARGRQEVVLYQRTPSGAPGKVAGLVYERGSKLPLANVHVSLVSTEPDYVVVTHTARTDSAGYYEFPAVEPGRWQLSIPADGLTLLGKYAPPRLPQVFTLARKQAVAALPFELGLATCVEGRAAWGDGYVLFDAPITIVPLDTMLAPAGGLANGLGDYRICDAADDSVMVWMHLRDGRSLGYSTRLSPGPGRRIDFKPEPLERMEGAPLRIRTELADGTPVPLARVTVVGRRFGQGDRPALVFVREATSDREGIAEFKAPFGNYEVMAMNPREGQVGSERIVVDLALDATRPLRIRLTGKHSAEAREAMRIALLTRAETALYVWGQ
jgi:hypothetical protein